LVRTQERVQESKASSSSFQPGTNRPADRAAAKDDWVKLLIKLPKKEACLV
jgi:hypothetical protein